jgi:hypothetical protein
MKNFRAIAYLDTFPVVGDLFARKPHEWGGVVARGEIGDVRLPVKSLLIRGPENPTLDTWTDDLPIKDTADYDAWPSLRVLIDQARAAILADQKALGVRILDPDGAVGRIMVSGLQPGGVIMWHVDNGAYHDRHVRFHISLVTNPGAFLYSEFEQLHMPVGTLWYFNNRVMHCAANWSPHTRYHVVFELPKLVNG